MNRIYLLLLLPMLALSAGDPLSVQRGRVVAADMDVRGQVYYIDSAYQLCRFSNGRITAMYSMMNYGEEPMLDAANPVEIFVFYRNSGYVVITDNNLNPVKEINLYTENNLSPGGFGRANDGNIWIYDDNTATLKKFDRSGRMMQESIMFGETGEGSRKLTHISDNGEHILVTTADSTTYLLNANLGVQRTWSGQRGSGVEILDRRVYFQQNNILVSIGTDPLSARPEMADTAFVISGNHIVSAVGRGYILLKGDEGLFLQPR